MSRLLWVGGGSQWWGSAIRLRDVAEAQMVIWKNPTQSGTKAKELERQEVEVDQ